MKIRMSAVCFLATALIAGAASTDANLKMSGQDKEFLDEAAMGGMAEVELGKLAEKQGMNQAVKDFGRQMASDHAAVNEELKALALSKNIELPKQIDETSMALKEKLASLKGQQFDRQYISAMVADHQKVIEAFKKASEDAKDPDVKAFASAKLPTLESHLEHAKAAEAKVEKASPK